MGQYTLTIKEIIDNLPEGSKIFDFSYPFYDETKRASFEQSIVDYFLFREIGVQTYARFKHNLKTKLNLIMPVYNKKFQSQALEQRILDNYDITEIFTKTGTAKRLFSDTPQGRVDLASSTNVTEINDDSDSENWTRTMNGNIGIQTDADAIMKYEQSLRNVNMEIIAELEELFMQVF